MAAPSSLLRWWLLIVVIALSIHLGGFPLLDPDEGRNAEVGREMAATNDYVMPRLDGLPYLDKPIVYFASEAAAMEVLGPTEVAARLPAFLFTIAGAAFLWWFAKRVWGSDEAFIAAIVFLATPLAVAFSRTVIFDAALALFITMATAFFYLACEERARKWSALAWLAIGLGVITKGPVAIALPLLVAIPYAIWRKRFRALWSWGGLALFVLAVAPWVWAVSRVIPDFLHYVVVTETAQRLATKALKRTGPPWYFIPYLLAGALPWSIVLLGSPRAIDRRDRSTIYLLLWIAIPFIFFSISQSKRPQYILPLMAPVALLVARVWQNARIGARITAVVLLVFGLALVIAPPFLHLRAEYGDAARLSAMAIGITFVIGGALAFVRNRDIVLIALTIPIVAIPLAANPLMRAIGARRSEAALMEQIRPMVTPQTEIVGVEAFTGSMTFYLQRPIVVVTPDAEEFTSNYLIRHYANFAGGTSIKPMPWLDTALADAAKPRIFIVRANDAAHRASLAAHQLRIIASDARYVAYAR
ncbi:MAG: glycosyltransferase family 39 protein [Acidobacteria bacterium]|nr:glycosyltransferase family 39 protein [Acidobacteriota bacterium]MBV9185147.1 glycosyltransferase family 39 protein [Acidobacteriota bacterium]